MRIFCFAVTPSPYQRDFFRSLAALDDCELSVAYFEHAPDDSPWVAAELESWESVMPGRVFGRGRVRCHWNAPLPAMTGVDAVIVNAPLTGITTQRLLRRVNHPGAPPWFFWGEQLLARRGWRGWIQRRLAAPLHGADAIVAIGRTAKADYEQRFPSVLVHDIPYACDLQPFHEAARVREAALACRFLFAGQMISRKGVDVLLAAFARLKSDGLPVELHLVGREGELPSWLASLPATVRKAVVYHGFVQPSGLPKHFSEADVFVLPSRYDGWGVVVNQALGAGIPVITSTAAGAGKDLVEDGINGLHVLPGDLTTLETAMRKLATRQDLRDRMSAAAKVTAERIGPKTAAARWLGVLRSLRGNEVTPVSK
jgi:glycosyltransferase involved in cell wall biosynthesis